MALARPWAAKTMVEWSAVGIYSRGNQPINVQLIQYFDPFFKTEDQFGKNISRTRTKDMLDGSWMYSFRKFGEMEVALSLFGSCSSIILMFLVVIFLILDKQLWEKRLPWKPISIRVVFLLRVSSIIASTDSEKKLSVSFMLLISLFDCNELIMYTRPESFNRHEEKSNF
jgi:hypothetical protein